LEDGAFDVQDRPKKSEEAKPPADEPGGRSVDGLEKALNSLSDLEDRNIELRSGMEDAQRRLSEAEERMASLEEKYESFRKSQLDEVCPEAEGVKAGSQAEGRPFWSRVSLAISENRRYLTVPIVVNLARILVALVLYFAHSSSGVFATTYMDWQYAGGPLGEPFRVPVPAGDWSYLFFAWDSIWYIRIAQVGYYGTRFAFFPTLPLAIRFFYSLTMDFGTAAVIVSFLFGTLWIPFYQAVAERYMRKDQALLNTFLCAFFPFVFLFTSVAYTESIFLLACVAAWYFYLRDKLPHSFAMIALATVTRIYGIFMLIPVILDLAAKKRWKDMLYSIVPAFALFLWCFYCYISTGDWLAFRTVQVAYWGSPTLFSEFVIKFFLGQPITWNTSTAFILAFTSIALYLAFASWEVDRKLGSFAIVGVVSNLFAGYIWSYTRHLTFFFPTWLVAKPSNKYLVAVACGLFLLCSIVLWNQFIMRQWVA
jgi:hypothetical protein